MSDDAREPNRMLEEALGRAADGDESHRESVRSRLFGGGNNFESFNDIKSGMNAGGLSEEQRL